MSGAARPMLADRLVGRDNNLNLIRVMAAAAVLVSHAFPIALGPAAAEPMVALTGQSLGHYAVAVFFGLSGLLIARSFDRRQSMIHFGLARVLRLFPALVVVLVLTVLAGALVSTLPPATYFTQAATWAYIPRNLSLAFLQYPLPGVFEGNPYGPPINGSLWTLFYEVVCYGAVVAIGLAGLLRRPVLFTALFAGIAAAHLWSLTVEPAGGIAYRLDRLVLLGFPFALGTLAYVWRDRLPLDGRIVTALGVVCLPLAGTPWMPPAIMVLLVYATLWFGFVPRGPMLAYNRLGDYSYGIYIYAFPVQQALVWLIPGQGAWQNVVLALPVTLVLAVVSWTLVERRTLDCARPLADRLAGRLHRDRC
jgi:peptidoglycan/LPS O-acetylase OafA/YrhL